MNRTTTAIAATAGPLGILLAASSPALASSTNPKHFVPPTAIPTYGPNNYVVTFDVGTGEISGYGTREVTGSTNLWTVGDAFTTKQEWTDMDDNRVAPGSLSVNTDAGTGFVHGPGTFTNPVLTAHAPGFISGSQNFYSFSNDYGADAVVANYGGPSGSTPGGGTLFVMQTAAGINPDYRPVINVGDITGPDAIIGGALNITKGDGSALPAAAQTLLFDKNFQLAETPTNFGNMPYQELIWAVWLPSWTGDFKVDFEMPVHTMFSSVRFDTAVGSMDGAPGLDHFTVGLPGPLYWDTNGTTAGAGGATPAGNWDGTAANFNPDATGGDAGGATVAVTSGSRDVVFAAGTDGGGTYSVTLTGTQSAKSVTINRGNVNLVGGTLATGAFNVAAGAAATVTSNVTGGTSNGVTKDGPGTFTLAAANSYTGNTTVNDGVLVAGHPNALSAAALSVNSTAVVRAQPGLTTALQLTALTVAAGAKLDLNDNAAALSNGGGAGSGAAGQAATRAVTAALKTGLENGGNFDLLGPGISSTEANADNALAGSFLYALGVVQNNLASAGTPDGTTTDATPGGEIYTTFKGRTVGLNDTLIRYTYMGDADLDGSITGTDYSLIDAGFAASLAGWLNGDFDYSGTIDGTDYALIDNAFASQVGPLSDAFLALYDQHVAMFGQEYGSALASVQAGVVPEPGTAGAVAVASCGALVIRRRRQNKR